jgi:hypothetical protein
VIARYDGTNDPPVVERIGDDEHSSFGKRLRFSAFVFRWTWDLLIGTAAQRNKPVLHANESEVGPPELDFLLENLTECFRERRFRGRRLMKNPFTGMVIKLFPFRFAFRHRSGLVSIQCQASPVRRSTEAQWVLLGNTERDLFALAKLFWACGDFARTLTAENETGRKVLRRLHQYFRA